MSGSTALSSEEIESSKEILRHIFREAFSGGEVGLPPGATVSSLREAISLAPDVASEIFEEEKRRARGPANDTTPANDSGSANDLGPADASRLPGATLFTGQPIRPEGRRSRRRGIAVAGMAAVVLIGGLTGLMLMDQVREPPEARLPTGELFHVAATSKTAFDRLTARARSGDADAAFDVATLFDSSRLPTVATVEKNDAIAVEWYRMAADKDHAGAQNNLAFAYQHGRGVTRDFGEAARLFRRAAEHGLADAQNSLGLLYQSGLGVAEDDGQARDWYHKAAAQGLAEAQNNLGQLYEQGRGVSVDYAEAAKWYGLAAEQGIASAQNSIGYLYYAGVGVHQDLAQSFSWFGRAAEQGDPTAEVNLAMSYASGAGTEKDMVSAAKWLFLARDQGNKDAASSLELLKATVSAADLATAQAAATNWRDFHRDTATAAH
ncbi:MAG TPA: tetratricopeptide repeat protein [Stellaceae bacterium]|nr:tetratricopeptide repeat protein [Stellaceae bacterium]